MHYEGFCNDGSMEFYLSWYYAVIIIKIDVLFMQVKKTS